MLYLSGDCDVLLVLVAGRPICWVVVVEDNADCCFCDACTSLFVHKFLKILGTHLYERHHKQAAADICESMDR